MSDENNDPSKNHQIKCWFESLKDLTDEQFRRGVKRFCQLHLEVYPNTNVPGYIRKYGTLEDFDQLTEGEAWALVTKEQARVGGFYGVPNINNSIVQKAVECIGWRQICLAENLEATRAHFFKIYNSLLERERNQKIFGLEVGNE